MDNLLKSEMQKTVLANLESEQQQQKLTDQFFDSQFELDLILSYEYVYKQKIKENPGLIRDYDYVTFSGLGDLNKNNIFDNISKFLNNMSIPQEYYYNKTPVLPFDGSDEKGDYEMYYNGFQYYQNILYYMQVVGVKPTNKQILDLSNKYPALFSRTNVPGGEISDIMNYAIKINKPLMDEKNTIIKKFNTGTNSKYFKGNDLTFNEKYLIAKKLERVQVQQ